MDLRGEAPCRTPREITDDMSCETKNLTWCPLPRRDACRRSHYKVPSSVLFRERPPHSFPTLFFSSANSFLPPRLSSPTSSPLVLDDGQTHGGDRARTRQQRHFSRPLQRRCSEQSLSGFSSRYVLTFKFSFPFLPPSFPPLRIGNTEQRTFRDEDEERMENPPCSPTFPPLF